MIKNERVSLFFLPTLIDPHALILTNITSDKDYIKNKYDSCLRNMGGRLSSWYDEEIKSPIYGSPKLNKLNINKIRRDELIDKIQVETLPAIGRRLITIDIDERKKFEKIVSSNRDNVTGSDLSSSRDNKKGSKIAVGLGIKNNHKVAVLYRKEKLNLLREKELSRNKIALEINGNSQLNTSGGNGTRNHQQAQQIDLKFASVKSRIKY